MNTGRRLFRNFVVAFTGSVLGQLLLFGGMIWVARKLGPESFGWWTFSQAILFYLLRIGEAGLEVIGIRSVARDPGILSRRVTHVLVTRALLSAGIILLVGIAAMTDVVPPPARSLVMLFTLCVIPMGWLVEWVFESQQVLGPVALARLFRGGLFAAVAFVLVRTPSDALAGAAAYVISVTVPAILLFIIMRGRFDFRWSFARPFEGAQLIKQGLPVAIATLCSQFSLFFGTVLIGYLGKGTELGLFSAAQRIIIFIWGYGVVTSNRVLLPTLSQYAVASPQEFRRILTYATRLLVLVALPVGLLGLAAAPWGIPTVFGGQYLASVSVFSILIWTLVLGIARSAVEIGLIAADRQRTFLQGMLLLAGIHAVFDTFGYVRYGIDGLAWGMLGAESLYVVWLSARIAREWLTDGVGGIIKAFGVGVAILVILLLFHLPWWGGSLLVCALYPLFLVLVGALTRDDVKQLRALLSPAQADRVGSS